MSLPGLRAVFFLTVLVLGGGFYFLKVSHAQMPSPIQQNPASLPLPAEPEMPPQPAMPAPGVLPGTSLAPPTDLPALRPDSASNQMPQPSLPVVPAVPSLPVVPAVSSLPVVPAVSSLPVVPAASPLPGESETAVMLEKINALEKRILTLENKMTEWQAVVSVPAEKKAAAIVVKKKRAAKRKPAHINSGAGSAHVDSGAGSAPWVLKSAKPGVAWVVRQGSDELRTVSVGEELQGLGRITAIAKDSAGRWVVIGTKSRMSQ